MQIFTDTKIDFMSKRKLATIFSLTLIAVSLASFFTRGLNFGLDFTGGTLIELGYQKSVELEPIRKLLADNHYDKSVVQHFGTSKDVLIRLAPLAEASEKSSGETSAPSKTASDSADNKQKGDSAEKSDVVSDSSDHLIQLLQAAGDGEVELRRREYVGPQVGDELKEDGGLAVLFALICIFVYVFLRFEWRFAAGAVVALFHDVIITVGVFSLLGLEFDLTVLAACLAVIGYSLNDTIVVFDRIRENFRKMRKGSAVEVTNKSLNDTLSRTLMTSFTTLLVLIALFIFGGDLIHGFATALIVGIVIGTYSSIYVASAAAIVLGVSKQDLMQPQKEREGDGDVV